MMTGSRIGEERRGAPLEAILVPVRKRGQGGGRGTGVIFDRVGEPKPRLHQGRLGSADGSGLALWKDRRDNKR